MSNLSDLLPAGAGAKVITATADGNLATGQTVALQSNGTVKGIAADANASSLGSAAIFAATGTGGTTDNCVAYDSVNNKILVAYKETNTGKGKAVVGTISGTSITFGTAAEFAANIQGDGGRRIGMCFNATEGKFVIVFRDNTINNYGRAVTATISGTSVSFGSSAVWSGTNATNHQACSFDSTSNRVVIVYTNDSDSNRLYGVVAKITGTSLSFGTAVKADNDSSFYAVPVYDSNADKTVFVYRDSGNSNYGTAIVASVSDMTISYGSAVVFESAQTEHQTAAYDSANSKIVVAYADSGNSGYGTAIVGTVSGTSISFGSAAVFESASTANVQMQAAYNVAAGKTVIGYGDDGNSTYGTYVEATVSGTSLTFSTPAVFNASTIDNTGAVAAYDSSNKVVVFTFQDEGNSNAGEAVAYASQYSNSSDFVGITNQAINNSASGEVVVEGGVITNGSLLPLAYTPSIGSKQIFDTDNIGSSYPPSLTFDSSSNKVIIAYRDATNSVSAAAVGTVSGTSITWGTPVNFVSASAYYISATFDSSNNKVVISYRDSGNSNYGTSIIGTVSGNSISFGTAVVFRSGSVEYLSSTFDSSANKVVLGYSNASNADRGEYVVGTVSGTSISFGTVDYFDSSSTKEISITYDSNANKTVFFFRQSNTGKAKVATLSGTAFSFGSQQTFGALTTSKFFSSAFDSSSNQIGVFYSDNDSSSHGTAKIGTISGTDISFGSAAVFESAEVSGISATFDSNSSRFVVFYADVGNGNYGTYVLGAVSGTDISFNTPAVIASNTDVGPTTITFDSSANRVVLGYRDASDSGKGTAQVIAITGAVPNFTIGSTYYVQDDGILSTTSSSVTAGKAIANTTLLLKG